MADRSGRAAGGKAAVFVGAYEHSFDDKGRIVLPAAFRNQIATGYLAPYQGCVALWSEEAFVEVTGNLKERVRSGEIHDRALRAFTAAAAAVKPDAQGRIMVPQHLRDYAQLEGSVTVTGNTDRVELWNTDTWNADSPTGLAELEETLSVRGL